MFLIAWWLTGVVLGWFIWASYRLWRPERPWEVFLSADQAGQLDPATRPLVESAIAILRANLPGQPQQDEGPVGPERPSARGAVLGLASVGVVALLVFILAAATDHAQLFQWMLVLKSYLVGVRVQTLIIGILTGVLFRQYRVSLMSFATRLANAVIGSGENTAWALQGALAVGLVAIGLFAIRPDFLLYIRSFKFGTVEATFGDQGPLPLRDARLNLREFRERVAIKQYENFRKNFILAGSPRDFARRRLTGEENSALQAETGRIAVRIFENYVDPVLVSILCLDKVHAIRLAIQDSDLAAYAAVWENFLRSLHDKKLELTRTNLPHLLTQLRERSEPFIARARDLNGSCMRPPETFPLGVPADNLAADAIFDDYLRAVALLKERKFDKPEVIISLVVFEPYLTGAVSDLIALISGEREKTDFLLNMLDGFPLSHDLITPGIINLYYQATYSWLNTTGSLPLDLVRSQIEYAVLGADVILARSADLLARNERGAPSGQLEQKIGTDEEKKAKDDADKAAKVYDIFLRNLFALLPTEVDIYVQRALAGEPISEQHRQSWIKAASRLHAMLRLRLALPIADIDGLNPIDLDERTKGRLRADVRTDPESKIDPDFLLQADLAIALSAILLQDGNRASAKNCNAALIYVNEASAAVQPTVEDNKLDRAQELRLRELIGAVANRIGDSCSWTDERGQKVAPKQEPKALGGEAK
ncbi:hypothetical protein JQ625_02515 [Bradyrhizobium diazoefficiens]|nr:hypothetical protein [Bradyrhizobium diazoefficiens]MBR0773695.1 hypothetical protein [Bradyrhizobium diazoefficiens]